MITFAEEKPKAVQLDFMDHLINRISESKDLKESLDLSQTFDQLLIQRPQSQGFKKVVQVRAHQRRV